MVYRLAGPLSKHLYSVVVGTPMTRGAECLAVGLRQRQVGTMRHWLKVVGVQDDGMTPAAAVPTLLAGVVVALEYSGSPFTVVGAICLASLAALPLRVCRAAFLRRTQGLPVCGRFGNPSLAGVHTWVAPLATVAHQLGSAVHALGLAALPCVDLCPTPDPPLAVVDGENASPFGTLALCSLTACRPNLRASAHRSAAAPTTKPSPRHERILPLHVAGAASGTLDFDASIHLRNITSGGDTR